jgi:hypothetical protein
MLVPLSHSTGWPGSLIMGAFAGGLLVSSVADRGRPAAGPGRPAAGDDRALPGGVRRAAVCRDRAIVAVVLRRLGVAGLARSMLLYPPAFAALTRWYSPRRVPALTTLSLVAGLSSTVFAPLTAVLDSYLGWRATDVVLAAVLGVVTLPLHATMLTPSWPAGRRPASARYAGGSAMPRSAAGRARQHGPARCLPPAGWPSGCWQ